MARQLQARVFAVNPETGETEAFGPGDDVPSWARKVITNPAAWAPSDGDDEGDEGDEDGDGEPAKPYSKWLKSDLQDELDRRNAERDDEDLLDAEVDGKVTVASLAAALDADDDAAAGRS